MINVTNTNNPPTLTDVYVMILFTIIEALIDVYVMILFTILEALIDVYVMIFYIHIN
jgi:hypothetical protein